MTNRPRRIVVAASLAAALCLADPALAAPRIYIPVPPPPIVVETRPVAPGPRHVWVGGYHRWDGGQEVEVRMRPADILRWARIFSSDALDPLALC